MLRYRAIGVEGVASLRRARAACVGNRGGILQHRVSKWVAARILRASYVSGEQEVPGLPLDMLVMEKVDEAFELQLRSDKFLVVRAPSSRLI